MVRNLIELADGRRITAGASGTAIMSLRLTQSVNSGTELEPGAVCAAMAEVVLMASTGCPIEQGDSFTLYRQEAESDPVSVGVFTAERPRWLTANTVSITAYDNVTRLDRDLTEWVLSLTDWPYTLRELARMVCLQCGVTLAEEELPNGDHPVTRFTADGVTGRQILGWIGQAAGRFCRADPEGVLHFGWYTPEEDICLGPELRYGIFVTETDGHLTAEGITVLLAGEELTLNGVHGVSDDGVGNVSVWGVDQYPCLRGSLELADYTTAPVERVQLRQSAADVGTVWPNTPGTANTYIIQGNPLLAAQSADTLLPIAKSLYEQLARVSYTPCTVTVPAGLGLDVGKTVQITDAAGRTVTAYIMQRQRSGQTDKLICTGNALRQSTTAMNNSSYQALSGKVLQLQTDVEGLRVEHTDTAGATAALSLRVQGIQGQVTAQEEQIGSVRQNVTSLQQSAEKLQLDIRSIQDNGVDKVVTATGYTFSQDGLRICKSGQEMDNRLDHTGMYVQRDGQVILQANNRGVTAVDVTVGNYLVVGSHARFEDYDGGTACFYV